MIMMDEKNIRYRRMPFQVKYKKDLDVIETSDATSLRIVNHFAVNGYENLYLMKKGKLSAVLTLDDFLSGKRVEGLDREFIRNLKDMHTSEAIIRFFIDCPYIDRITIVDNGELVCEIDGLIELPLQNGTAKNIMTLRYADIFKKELTDYFENCGKILLMADKEISGYLSGKFPSVHFEAVDSLDAIPEDFEDKYVLIDLIYSKNIRRVIGFAPENLVSMSQLVMGFALKRFIGFCREKGIQAKFYRVQNYRDLTCLNASEYDNCISRIKTGLLLQDEEYMERFLSNDKEKIYLKNREYHASLRLDNGYCFIQDECNEPGLHVHSGIRNSGGDSAAGNSAKRVHFFGPCTTYGFLMPDEETIPSLVKQYALEEGIEIETVNQAGIHGYNELNAIMAALRTPVREGDIMIFYDSLEDLDFSEYPDAKQTYEWFNAEKSSEDIWFLDFPGHCGLKANELIARHIFADIKDELRSETKAEISSERSSYIGDSFDRLESMRVTHSSCIKFFHEYGDAFFDTNELSEIGAVVIPDSYDYEKSIQLAERAVEKCDALYILKYNDCLSDIGMSRSLFENRQINLLGKAVQILQPGYFFDSSRYLSDRTGMTDCLEEYLFTERALAEVLLKGMSVSVRCIPEDTIPMMYKNKVEKIYRRTDIKVVYI